MDISNFLHCNTTPLDQIAVSLQNSHSVMAISESIGVELRKLTDHEPNSILQQQESSARFKAKLRLRRSKCPLRIGGRCRSRRLRTWRFSTSFEEAGYYHKSPPTPMDTTQETIPLPPFFHLKPPEALPLASTVVGDENQRNMKKATDLLGAAGGGMNLCHIHPFSPISITVNETHIEGDVLPPWKLPPKHCRSSLPPWNSPPKHCLSSLPPWNSPNTANENNNDVNKAKDPPPAVVFHRTRPLERHSCSHKKVLTAAATYVYGKEGSWKNNDVIIKEELWLLTELGMFLQWVP